jgi:SAM-dependent methyltransferase
MDLRWYERFFEGVTLEMWRRAGTLQPTAQEADFVARSLSVGHGARILDVPCGLGRHAIEMAKRGFSVTGIDLSREAIEDARRNGAAAGVEVDWRVADMRDLPWHGELDGAFCLGNSFGYLDPSATRDFLRSLSRSLKAGARFALDYGLAAECILPRMREREWCQVGDIHFLEENRYHVAESCVETTYTFIQNGRTEVKTGLQWVWTVREVRAMLADAGLDVEGLFKSPAGEPFEVGAPILLLVARKTG